MQRERRERVTELISNTELSIEAIVKKCDVSKRIVLYTKSRLAKGENIDIEEGLVKNVKLLETIRSLCLYLFLITPGSHYDR